MKKTSKILCLILALFMCAFFPACKGRYDKLKMSFYLNDGKQINEVHLVMDDTDTGSLSTQKIYVQFDGIKEKYIGDVLFHAEPADRVEISNITQEGNKYFATVNALNEGAGKIYIKHLTTGKTSSINFVADKKSTSVTKLTNEYFISIPNVDETLNFDVESLITQNGTDQIGFRLDANSNKPNGVEFIETKFNEDIVISGLQLSNNISHGTTLTVYPVSYMEGYETVDVYTTQKIDIKFVKALDETSFVLDADTLHQPYLENVFYLIANDTEKAQTIEGVNYKFNDVQFDLKYTENNNIFNMWNDTKYRYLDNFYDVSWDVPNEFKNVFEVFFNENNQVVVEAKNYTENPVEISICLTPKVCGNLAPVNKTIRVKGEVKPKEYEISVQGKIQANVGVKNKYNIDLYDYYRSSDSVYGAGFTFNPVAEYSYADLKNVKIKVNPAILDVKDGNSGTNELETNGLTGYTTSSNKYLLQFYLDGKPLKFEMVEETKDNQTKYYAVSEIINYFTELKRVQIKYTEKAQDDTEALACYVENFYSGEFEYLKSIQPTTAEIQFNHKEGITDTFVNAGTLTKNVGDDTLTRLVNTDEPKVDWVYLNRTDKTMNTIFVDKLLGVNNKIVSGATIDVKVTNNFSASTPLKLKQNRVGMSYNLGDGNTEILYNYNATNGQNALPNNAIILGLTNETDVGYYTIEFWYADELIYSVTCFVYEELELEQITIKIADNKNIKRNAFFDGKDKYYINEDYKADYLIKADNENKIKFQLLLPSQFTADYIKGYDYNLLMFSDEGDTQVDLTDYATKVKNENQVELTFKKGSIIDHKINYIKLQMFIERQEFTNIITKGETTLCEVEIDFFVYEEIKPGQISLNKTNVSGYCESSLSAYYKDLSRTTLQVNLTDSKLWDYVQEQTQEESYNLGKKLETAKVVWFTDDTDELVEIINQTQTSIELQFNSKQGTVSIDVFAKIKQFDSSEIVLQCHIVITEPIVTTSMYVTSETKQISGSQARRVISLQAGQTYQMEVEYYSDKFERLSASERKITNPGFVMLVLDRFGNVHDSVVSVDGAYLKVANNFTLASELHVVVFAKDALKEKLTFRSGYTEAELANYFMDGHENAYVSIDLIVSNGDKLNPYPVFTEEDFWAIGKDGLSLTKHYVLMNNVYLTYKNNETWFDNFSGGLTSYGSDNFTVFGVKLDDNHPYLFKQTTGATISNVKFDAKINFTSIAQEQARGVFGVTDENTELCDVTINLFGESVSLMGETNKLTYFGALVGVNNGVIKYENLSSVGSEVEILTLSGSYAYFGGLVGRNYGTINGVLKNQNETAGAVTGGSKVVFGGYIGNAGALSSVKISAYGFNSGAIGGAVGLNETAGEIKDGYVTGEIVEKQNENGIRLNNVGGVIGKNIANETNARITLSGSNVETIEFAETAQLTNLKSAVQISANENVGGITGVDENGIYAYCKYQILANYTYGIKANEKVGGIVGNATNSKMEFCSVYSYRWDYNHLADIGLNSAEPDISSSGSVGGLVGLANSTASTISVGEYNILAIKNSSVNAYVSGNVAHALVGKRNTRPNAEINCYLVGKIVTGEGKTVGFKGDNNGGLESANANHSYVKTNELEFNVGEVSYISTSRSGWNMDSSYNGGYPYIVSNNKPIFEVAPTSISLSLKENSVYAVKDSENKVVESLAHVVFYDLNLNVNDADYVNNYQIQTGKNTHDMVGENGMFNLTVLPTDLSEVRLNAVSSNPSVVMISNDKIIARGVGQAELTFTSVLNNAVKASYLIDVSKPIGNTLKLYISRDKNYLTPNGDNGTINITKGEAIILQYIAEDDWAGFDVTTNENTCLQVEVNATKSDGTILTNDEINTYLQIVGQGLIDNKIELNYNQPFSIKAIEKDESITFTFKVTPYIIITTGTTTYKQLGVSITFNLKTVTGLTGIALSAGDLVLYPNDNTVITAYLTTDREVKDAEALKLIDHLTINSTVLEAGANDEVFGKITDYISVVKVGELNNDHQEIEFKLTIPTLIKDKLLENNKNLISIVFKAKEGLGTGVQDSIQLNVIKQRIDELVVRNYIYKRLQNDEFDYTSYEQNNTLRPISEGLILIDISPINGYFDYLEISDITGSEEIVFVQTRGIHGTRVDGSLPSSDGKGIRLNHIGSDKTISVATMISSTYSNKPHTVKVSAFVAGEVVKTTTIDIDVKMKPEIAVYLVKPDGTVERNATGIQYVALGTQLRFKVETNNCDEGVEPTVTAKFEGGTEITLVNEGNGYYSINANDTIGTDNLGKDLTIEASSYLTLDSNTKEQTTTIQKFKIVNYVIDNVSVTHSTTNTVNGKNVTKIYGNLNVNVPIEFYFKNSDIEYREMLNEYTQETYYSATDKTKQSIHGILTGINTIEYITFNYSRLKIDDGERYYITKEDTKIELKYNNGKAEETVATLYYGTKTVNGKTINALSLNLTKKLDIDLVLTLPLKLDDNNNFNLDNDGINQTYRFNVDFIEESSFLQPKAVRNEDDFNTMSSGGDYILAKDIVLTNYSPLDLNLNSFDGNGHTITIKSFAPFSETTINAGLFKQIYEDMVVMNLEVIYDITKTSSSSYYDLCNNSQNVAYTTANFGGLTVTNYGIISNCKVSGSVQLSASSVEQASSNDEVSFNIGGLVNANETTGRITNSISALKITAKANIAGFVYTNAGKIASSFFDATSGKGMIYAYNSSVTVPYSISVAGFVLENESSAEISMCYVESGTHTVNRSTIGNISAKDYSSGFVYTNAGSIYDCYADIALIGESSNNHITGFVYGNTGSVNNCYSYINEGKKTNLISMFARENTTGITNCYEVKQDTAGYKNNVEGLTTVSSLERTNKNKYPTFMFGDNVSAVWVSNEIDLPKLVATSELVTFTGETMSQTDELKDEQGLYPSYYRGLKDLQLVKTETKNDFGVVISVDYSYKVLEKDYGEKQNPILIYNLATWDYYLGQTDEANSFYQNTKYYYRLINDIDFETIYNNPTTSVCEFNGNLQGNNMDVANFKIFSSANLSSIGLFASLKSLNNQSIESAVRNLDIIPLSVTATRTQTVGVLAGMAENYNLYNIDIEAENITIVGGNAVGGVVGLVRGRFDIDGITSTVGAYASRSQQENNYAVYTSNYSLGKMVKDNLASVYYAGGAFAILDASTVNSSETQININSTSGTQTVRHIATSSSTNLFGDTVGGAVGLVGKKVKLENITSTINAGKLSGYQLSAGLVGENRGLIENATVSISGEDVFKSSTYVSAGAVGFNFNGYINNVSVTATITKTNQSVVAGVVGRNLNGVVNNVSFDGTVSGYYVGGIIGADYTVETYKNKTEIGGGGAIRLASSELTNLSNYTYYSNGSQLPQFANLKLSANCIENLISKSSDYYSYMLTGNEGNVAFRYKKVLGLAIGLTDKDAYNFHYGYDVANKQFVINSVGDTINIDGVAGFTEDESFVEKQKITLGLINYISSFKLSDGKDVAKTIIMFVVGAKVESLDFWVTGNGYSFECFAFIPSSSPTKCEFKLNATVGEKESSVPVYVKKSVGSLFIQADKDSYQLNYAKLDSATITADCDSINAMFDNEKYETHQFTFDNAKNTLILSLTKKVNAGE